jgi:hypothetical protein
MQDMPTSSLVKSTRKYIASSGLLNCSIYLALNLLHVVIFADFVAFRVSSDGPFGVFSHGYLMRLDETDLAILVKDSE